MIEHLNEKVTCITKSFNNTKVSDFLAERPTIKDDIFGETPDATLSADLIVYMESDPDIPYTEMSPNDKDKDFILNIIKSKLWAAL